MQTKSYQLCYQVEKSASLYSLTLKGICLSATYNMEFNDIF